MGGQALKNCYTRRYDKEEFELLQEEVLTKLRLAGITCNPTKYYRDKDSFGDLDIIAVKPSIDPKTIFDTKEVFKNGNTVSFEYKEFQIDLIFVSEDIYEYSQFYFSYNDLNNLVGRIAHKLGLKLGFTGLEYPLRFISEHYQHKVVITRDCRKTYDFLGLDYGRYLQGFDSLEDIFNFVRSSKYFDTDIFSYENMNHINRVRNAKRATYRSFLEWLALQPVIRYEFNPDKLSYMGIIDSYFPEADLLNVVQKEREKHAKITAISKKFNGHLIMEWLGLSGKELGAFISSVKTPEFEEWVYTHSEVEVEHRVRDIFSNFKRPA